MIDGHIGFGEWFLYNPNHHFACGEAIVNIYTDLTKVGLFHSFRSKKIQKIEI